MTTRTLVTAGLHRHGGMTNRSRNVNILYQGLTQPCVAVSGNKRPEGGSRRLQTWNVVFSRLDKVLKFETFLEPGSPLEVDRRKYVTTICRANTVARNLQYRTLNDIVCTSQQIFGGGYLTEPWTVSQMERTRPRLFYAR